MKVLNISGYLFTPLDSLIALRQRLLDLCADLKGTILLSVEGININLAGPPEAIQLFIKGLHDDPRFKKMTFKESDSDRIPFKFLKIKIKQEVVTFRQAHIRPELQTAPTIAPELLNEWLTSGKEFTFLDTRNDFEVAYGTFNEATHLNLKNFSSFAKASHTLDPQKPVVMFCTGGIRCEKASLYLLQAGFAEVYQLEGGILNYFAKVGGAHFKGHCFVFDERIALDSQLQPC